MQMISVTQALSPYYKIAERMRPGVLEHAAARGTAVHKACALIALDLPIIDEIPDECRGYIDSFEIWLSHRVLNVFAVERRLEDAAFGFCGHIDIHTVLTDESFAIVDLKTPLAHSRLWRAQLSGYRHLGEANKLQVDKVGSLRLSPDGKAPKMDWYEGTEKEDFAIFLSALNAYRNLML